MPDNASAIVDYFLSGAKPSGQPGRIGVEIEHTVVTDDSRPVSFSGPFGVHWLLEQLAERMPERSFGEGGTLIGVADGDTVVTLEPAAQLELSCGPYEQIGEIRLDCEGFQRDVTALLSPHGRKLLAVGYHPSAKAASLELIPKERYRAMHAHFASIGSYGTYMMRGSASTQLSIDYYSADDCIRKLRLASALSPIFALICDNSPTFEAGARPHQLMRTEIWRECDPARCGFIPGVFDADFSLERLARYVLDTPAIIVEDAEGNPLPTERTFGELYAETAMGQPEIEHALSLLFNDVRLKTYVEIRPADAMPTPFVVAYAALVKGLFYDEGNLDELDELTASVQLDDAERAKTDLMAGGYEASVYGMPVGEFIDTLFELARGALRPVERTYLAPLSQMARSRQTLATLAERHARG